MLTALVILIVLLLVLALWSLIGYLSSAAPQAEYTVITHRQGYEVREYEPCLLAQTTVTDPYRPALNAGFRILAAYIFGGNTSRKNIPMTAPVRQSPAEKIPMTSPVSASIAGDSHVVSFVMPSGYTPDTLPTPTDSRIRIVPVPMQRVAALTFSWLASEERVQAQSSELLACLARDKTMVLGKPSYAGYNPPWTPP